MQKSNFDKLYNFCIENKHIQIKNYKSIISIIQKLKAIYKDLWRLNNFLSFAESQYKVLLLNDFTKKS